MTQRSPRTPTSIELAGTSSDVDVFITHPRHPLAPETPEIRSIVRGADRKIAEGIESESSSIAASMADILQEFPIAVPPSRVYEAVSQPSGLDAWWTLTCSGAPAPGAEYELGFGPEYQWRARVTKAEPSRQFELQLTEADADWMNTRVGFELTPTAGGTQVSFYHVGWPVANTHYRISCHCWAMYLRLLRRHLENGEEVPYERRLEA